MHQSKKANLIHRIIFKVLKARLKKMEVYEKKLQSMSEEDLLNEAKKILGKG